MKGVLGQIYGYSDNNGKLLFGISLGLGVAGTLLYFHRKRMANMPPKKWRKVGEISEIICYPIRSCGPVRLTSIKCDKLGFEDGYLRDRLFILIDRERNLITARGYPHLLQIHSKVENEKMIITAPNMPNIEIDFIDLQSFDIASESVMFGRTSISVIDCGNALAKWFSQFINQKDDGFRLVFVPKQPFGISNYMLMNQASVDDLNSRIDNFVTPLQFRPNLVVKGPEPFAEDKWNWIRIGDETVFQKMDTCKRCIMTNIDPATSKRNPSFEPLKTLQKYRNIIPNEPPVMGIFLDLHNDIGTVSINDDVFVEDNN